MHTFFSLENNITSQLQGSLKKRRAAYPAQPGRDRPKSSAWAKWSDSYKLIERAMLLLVVPRENKVSEWPC